MPRLSIVLVIAIAAGVIAAEPAASASARDKQKASSGAQYRHSTGAQQYRYKPAKRPQVIIRDRSLFGPPPLPPSSTERNYYGPAPGIQPPMERVPMPAPLANPPIR